MRVFGMILNRMFQRGWTRCCRKLTLIIFEYNWFYNTDDADMVFKSFTLQEMVQSNQNPPMRKLWRIFGSTIYPFPHQISSHGIKTGHLTHPNIFPSQLYLSHPHWKCIFSYILNPYNLIIELGSIMKCRQSLRVLISTETFVCFITKAPSVMSEHSLY